MLTLVLAGLFPVSNIDTFGHLAAGRQIVELGRVPLVDTFGIDGGSPRAWNNHNWLSGVLLYLALVTGGGNGVLALKLVLLSALAWVLWRTTAVRSGPPPGPALGSLLTIAAVPAVRFRLSARPHVFGLLAAAVVLLGLHRVATTDDARTRLRWGAGLVVVQIVWINLHGSSLLGLMLTGAYLVAHLRRPRMRNFFLGLWVAQLAASCVTPFGWGLLAEAVHHAGGGEASSLFREWRGWSADDPAAMMAIAAAFLALLALGVRGQLAAGPAGWASLLCALGLAWMALGSVRFLPWFLLLATPMLASDLARRMAPRVQAVRVTRVMLAYAAAVSSLAFASVGLARTTPPSEGPGIGMQARNLPVASADWLDRYLPTARVGCALEECWYVSFGAPRTRVLIDGRLAVYGAEHYRRVLSAFAVGSQWLRLLDTFRIDAAVLNHSMPEHAAARRALLESPRWQVVMIEDADVLFIRRGGARDPLIEQHALSHLPVGYVALPKAGRADPAAVKRELRQLEHWPQTGSYRGWVEAQLLLAGLMPHGPDGGLHGSGGAAQRAALRQALPPLRVADDRIPGVPQVTALHALVAMATCNLDEAARALQRLEGTAASRTTLLLRQEWALRTGDAARVRDTVRKLRQMGGGTPDPWLDALEQAAQRPPRCE
ncbi:MAG: hypothetical protein PVI30_01300 [Myxococcales bacterium]